MSGDHVNYPSTDHPQRKLKLVLKTSPLTTAYDASENISKDGSSSPPRPSFSPVTPTMSHTKLVKEQKAEPIYMEEPPPLSISLEENPDAIALRATLSLLQMQRQQSLKDIRDLDRIRDAAMDDPDLFVQELQAGNLKKPAAHEIVLDDIEYEDDDDETSKTSEVTSKFSKLPNPQNITRCPPIEWSKYHILGDSLNQMHEHQKQHPGVSINDFASEPHSVTAPYRPFKEKISDKKVGE